jgi:hypothetical protein
LKYQGCEELFIKKKAETVYTVLRSCVWAPGQ